MEEEVTTEGYNTGKNVWLFFYYKDGVQTGN